VTWTHSLLLHAVLFSTRTGVGNQASLIGGIVSIRILHVVNNVNIGNVDIIGRPKALCKVVGIILFNQ
jgi:hypothetical protein